MAVSLTWNVPANASRGSTEVSRSQAQRLAELAQSLAAEGLGSRQFLSRYTEPGPALAADLWDLEGLAAAYRQFLVGAEELTAGLEADLTPERGFAVRSLLVHEWRKFLFTDPGLPADLLPADWAGHGAAAFFAEEAARLQPAASRFVDACLAGAAPGPSDDPRPSAPDRHPTGAR